MRARRGEAEHLFHPHHRRQQGEARSRMVHGRAGRPPGRATLAHRVPALLDLQGELPARLLCAVGEALFANAPKGLFVFAKHDLDDTLLSLDGGVRDGVAGTFPKKGEPLLQYRYDRERVLAADGSTDGLKASDLFAPSPEGPISLPCEARNTEYTFSLEHTPTDGRAMLQSDPPSRKDPAYKPFTTYRGVIKAYDACVLRVWKPVEKKVAALRNTRRRTAAEEQALLELEATYGRKEAKAGRLKQMQKARQAYYAAMVKVNNARRDKALQGASKRLRKLFDGECAGSRPGSMQPSAVAARRRRS